MEENKKFEKGIAIGVIGGVLGTLGIQYAIQKVGEYIREVEMKKYEKFGEVFGNILDKKLSSYLKKKWRGRIWKRFIEIC